MSKLEQEQRSGLVWLFSLSLIMKGNLCVPLESQHARYLKKKENSGLEFLD